MVKAFNDKLDHIINVMSGSVILETNIVTLRVSDIAIEISKFAL